MHKAILQHAAEEDLIDIWLYSLDQWGLAKADHYLDSIDAAIRSMQSNPEIGSECDWIKQGIRRLVVKQHLIFYRISSYEVNIIRILHQSMDVDAVFD